MTDPYVRYDYAWQTPGWSAQAPVINYGVDGYVDPGLPADISKVRVYGKFMEMDTGRPLEGTLRLRTSKILTHATTKSQVLPHPQRIRFRRGEFSIYLAATDDPQLTPSFEYEARLTVSGYTQEFTFTLPASVSEVNVLDLINASKANLTLGNGDAQDAAINLGTDPQALDVHLTTGADFEAVLTRDEPWPVGTTVRLVFQGSYPAWVATVSGNNATFLVDKAVADTIPSGTRARLEVLTGTRDEVWAVGSVHRHE